MILRRYLSSSACFRMPYKPEERPPMTPQQKKLYPQVEQKFTNEGYPILNFWPAPKHYFERRTLRPIRRGRRSGLVKEREKSMKEDQDWPSVWPTAKTFVPSAVPLPLRQSYEKKKTSVPLIKYKNNELLKIPNFLHLTPSAIERHCRALRKFCTEWPEGLETDEQIREHFPITFTSSSYLHASPSIRDFRARKVVLQIYLNDLKLEPLDRQKLILLAGHRYDPKSDILSIKGEACPMRQQNRDYAEYLLTALYFESIKHEPWEFEKEEEDNK